MADSLRDQLGPIPDGYTAQGGNRADDYQVTLYGPAGRAVIHALNDGQGFEIETSFHGDHIRFDLGSRSPAEALAQVIELNRRRQIEVGAEAAPQATKKSPAMVIALILLAAGIALVIWNFSAIFGGVNDSPAPTPPSQFAPITLVTVYGDGEYNGDQCDLLHFTSLSGTPKAAEATAQYNAHCEPVRIVGSPAPEETR